MTTSAAASSHSGTLLYLPRRSQVCRKYITLSSQQFIAGVVDTSDNISTQCHGYWSEITKKPKLLFKTKLFTGVKDTADKIIAHIVDTGDKTVLPISTCLHLNLKIKHKVNQLV